MKKKHKVLIIKVGYSETMDSEISNMTSYGDVLRSTVLLNLYKNVNVTWLVDEKAVPILKGNPYISRILIYNLTSVLQLQAERFDTVINLEKVPGLCALADSVNAWRRYGFRFDAESGEAEAYDRSQGVFDACMDIDKKRRRNISWQESLFEMVGAEWKGEEYVLGYRPKSVEKYDIGFNYQIGNKWPLKSWPMASWKKLETLINGEYSVCWQQGQDDMEKYFEWINSCRLLVTNDSFGMHIALALKKPVIALFGPTAYWENHSYDRASWFYSKDLVCKEFPCRLDRCVQFEDTCLSRISPDEIYQEVLRVTREFTKSKGMKRENGQVGTDG